LERNAVRRAREVVGTAYFERHRNASGHGPELHTEQWERSNGNKEYKKIRTTTVRSLTSLSKYCPLPAGWDPSLSPSLATAAAGLAPRTAPMPSVLALRPTNPELLPSDQLMD